MESSRSTRRSANLPIRRMTRESRGMEGRKAGVMGGLRRRGMRIGLRRGRFPREVKRPARGEYMPLGVADEGRIISISVRCRPVRESGMSVVGESTLPILDGSRSSKCAQLCMSLGGVKLERGRRWQCLTLAVCGYGGQTVGQTEPGRVPAVLRMPWVSHSVR